MLRDTFGRVHTYLRISLTERCNLRCVYCMPEHGVSLTHSDKLLHPGELSRLVKLFATLGVNKVRLTGGEPTVRKDIVDVCRMISATPGIRTVAMTTNGVVLHRMLGDLVTAGLTAVNISLDTLRDDRFMQITRRPAAHHHRVMDAIRLAETSGRFDPVKVNCVVMKGVNDDELCDFVALTKDRNLEVRFIEFMPFDDNHWARSKMMTFMEMVDSVEGDRKGGGAATPSTPPAGEPPLARPGAFKRLVPVRSMAHGDTARLFRIDGHRGRIGFITSMTNQFCGQCNRLRLTADGNLKVCLFGSDEVSLRDPLRSGASDEDIADIIKKAVLQKHEALGGRDTPEGILASRNRPMITIGG